jgi:hypothetical protein
MPFGQPTGNSVYASGNVAAPGAGVAVCTIAAGSLPAGTYSILASAGYGAIAGAVDDMRLQAGATNLVTLRVGAAANVQDQVNIDCVRNLDGATALTINAIAGVAGNYVGTLVATPIRGV